MASVEMLAYLETERQRKPERRAACIPRYIREWHQDRTREVAWATTQIAAHRIEMATMRSELEAFVSAHQVSFGPGSFPAELFASKEARIAELEALLSSVVARQPPTEEECAELFERNWAAAEAEFLDDGTDSGHWYDALINNNLYAEEDDE